MDFIAVSGVFSMSVLELEALVSSWYRNFRGMSLSTIRTSLDA